MEVTSEYEGGASLLPPSTSTDVFLNAEGSGASAVDLLGAFDPDSFDFESKDLSPAWLNDIFSTNHRFPAELVPRLTGENNVPEGSEATPAEQRSCQNPRGICICVATGLLKSMHASSPSCLLDTGSQDPQPHLSRAVDDVLSANQGALQSLRGFLGCPCYTNHELQLLITAICAEVITWYWRIIHTYSRHHNMNVDNGILLADRIETRKRSFSVGDHFLEGDLEITLISQVLFSRLQELEDFIEDLAWNGDKSGTPNSESKRCPMLNGVHVRLDTFLNSQLSVVRRDLHNLQDGTPTDRAVQPGARN